MSSRFKVTDFNIIQAIHPILKWVVIKLIKVIKLTVTMQLLIKMNLLWKLVDHKQKIYLPIKKEIKHKIINLMININHNVIIKLHNHVEDKTFFKSKQNLTETAAQDRVIKSEWIVEVEPVLFKRINYKEIMSNLENIKTNQTVSLRQEAPRILNWL